MAPDTKKHVPKKNNFFVIEKYIEDVKHDEKHVLDLTDNKASWSCKRRVTTFFVQNESIWVSNPRHQGFNFLNS